MLEDIGIHRLVPELSAWCDNMHQTVGYRGADKSLARSTSRCILFDASLVTYINSTNIPQIIIINRIYENQNLLSL